MSEEAQSPAGSAAAPGGGSSKLVMIASVVNLLGTVGIIAVLLLSHQKEKSKPTVEDIVAGQAAKGHGEAKAEHGGGEHGGGEHGGGEHGGGEHGGGHGEKAEDAQPMDVGKIITLDPFTVNLTTGIGTNPRYVRMNVSIELEEGASDKEFEIKTPRVRDTVISLLNARKASDLVAVEGREQLKDDIKRSVNAFMTISKVKGVYFTNFAISN